MKNKNHWYDGVFYDRVIAPHQDKAFAHIKELIADGGTVVDVGCGTGRLALQLADKCSSVDGLDPSKRNIAVAREKLSGRPEKSVRFHHADAHGFFRDRSSLYDYATISYVIHEVDEKDRIALLQALASSTRNLIMVDYLVPQPESARKILNEIVEFVAGRTHYRNFKSFVSGNGLIGLAERAGLHIVHERKNDPVSSHIVVATREPVFIHS